MTDVRVVRVDESGVVLAGAEDLPVDVLFDDRRVWSFWLLRDTEPTREGRFAAWPQPLRKHLDGSTRVEIAEHVSGRGLYDAEQRFGAADRRIEVVDHKGRHLGIDKSGRLSRTFENRTADQVAPLLDSIEKVLGALNAAGVEAFPAYGTLLGAVRDGALIGHDSDADLGYVSKQTHPVEVMLESFRLQRSLTDAGYPTTRYSGVAFKVDVLEADGAIRGLDVFGGFMTGGNLYLMGEVGHPFETEWIYPLGTTTLEGRELPAPAAPEHLLEAMYGPGWKVPDPAFQFVVPRPTVRRLDGWFRGTRTYRDDWARRFSTLRDQLPASKPSALARFMVRREGGVPAQVIDIGAGRGRDALWLARQGAEVTAYDFVANAATAVRRAARREKLPLEVRALNLLDWRSVFGEGARLARRPGPRVATARLVAGSTTRFGRHSLWRFAAMALRDGGRLYVEHWIDGGEPRLTERRLKVPLVVGELERYGATIVATKRRRTGARRVAWIVAEWPREADATTTGGTTGGKTGSTTGSGKTGAKTGDH